MRDTRLLGDRYYEVITNYKANNEVVNRDVEHVVFMTMLWRAAFLQSKNDYEVAKQLVNKALYEVERFVTWQIGDYWFASYPLNEVE